MFSKVLILALATVANCVPYEAGIYGAGLGLTGVPVYRTSANYGGVIGYGANLGVAGLGAYRTVLGGGYGVRGGLLAGGVVAPSLAYGGAYGVRSGLLAGGVVAPAVVGGGVVAAPAVSAVGYGGLGLGVAGLGLGVARGLPVAAAGPVNAAVQTVSRTVDYSPVPYIGEPAVVQDVDVPPQESPLRINFHSRSSPLAVTQQHIPAEPGQVQVTQSEDEPQTAIHNVLRPVVQQVNEVVQPYRTLTQTVNPVIENTHTNIAAGEGARLTGLTSGVVGGTGIVGAGGVAVAAPAVVGGGVAVAAPAVAAGYGVGAVRVGVPTGVVAGLGYGGLRVAAPAVVGGGLVGGVRTVGLANAGLYGTGLYGNGVYGSGVYGSGVYGSGVYGSGVYGSGVYGTGLRTVGYGGVYGSGLAVNGLGGVVKKVIY